MHTSMMMAVNSPPVAHRDHSAPPSAYRPYSQEHYASTRRLDRPAQPEPERKKDKKWSLGKLFRRKKKEDESTTSDSEDLSARSPSKRKSKKKKRAHVPPVNNFDHIVIRDTRRAQSLAKPANRDVVDEGVLSDPSGFIYRNKTQPHRLSESLDHDRLNIPNETPTRKTRKGRLKARVEALRNSVRDSSSDEESLKSSNSSTMLRFRSDDSLMRSRDSSLNKRSRSARNERYIKRLSRDDENQLNKEAELLQQGYSKTEVELFNKEAELLQQGYSKAEVEMLTRTPTSQSSGYGTCKRDCNNIKEHTSLDPNRRPLKSESVSSFPSTQSYPSSINFNAKVNNEHINYSIPYQNGTKEPIYANTNRGRSLGPKESPEVICVKFPLGNVTNIRREEKAPPVPPPRDMQRKVATPISMYYETNPIVTDRMGSNNGMHGVPNNDFERVMRRSQDRTMGHLRRPISNSEDHIALQNNEHNMQNIMYRSDQPRRPASVSAEPNHYSIYANTPPWRKNHGNFNNMNRPLPVKPDYLYFADQSPRSRKPISIKTSQNGYENYLSDSQASLNPPDNAHRRPRNASDFWKKIDETERQRKQHHIFATSRSNSNSLLYRNPYIENKTRLQRAESADIQNKNRVNHSTQSLDTTDGAKMWKATTEYRRAMTVEPPKPQNLIITPTSKTHVRHKSDTFISNYQTPSDDEKHSERRKSTNLDDALNELEAIYNSLGLGDEDLLDRAEQRELMTPKLNDNYNDWNGNDEVQLRSQPVTPLRRMPRRSTLPDKLQDDMAFRRLNSQKEKPNVKEAQTQISYMLASPVYVPYASDDDAHSLRNEPDIVHDDVVYRNITQANNRLKTLDPQPPFGIPVGPVSPAPLSDYLHAMPESKTRSRFESRRSPDLVSDDLAYRNLRKDNRHSSVINGEEYNGHINNNSYAEFPLRNDSASNLKKKRAVRSLSANIFTMIQKEIDDALNLSKQATIQKTQSNSDVIKRLRETFEKNDNDQDGYPRNKVKHRHNTVNITVNNPHLPANHSAKDDSFIHSDDNKYLCKPPSCDKSKSSSPSNRSPQASKRSSKGEFQQVLSMLAQEAMDTSNKLGVALAELDKNRNNDKKADAQTRISDSRQNFLNMLTNQPAETKTVVKHVKVHGEIIDDTVTAKMPISSDKENAKKTEDSLLIISDQLHKVEDQLKHSIEKEQTFDDESISNFIAKTEEELKARETKVTESRLRPLTVPLHLQNDSIKVVNRETESKTENKTRPSPKYNSLNPFLNCDEKVTNVGDTFKELKDGISDLISGISKVNDKLFIHQPIKPQETNVDVGKITGISEASEKLSQVAQSASQEKRDAPCRASVNLSIYEDDLEIKKDATDSNTEYNSSEELATIFKLDGSKRPANMQETSTSNESGIRDDLSSPKLVKSMNQQLRRLSVDQEECTPSQSSLPTNVVPWRKRQNNPQSDTKDDSEPDLQSTTPWHDSTLMLACYTLMLTQHLAHLDWLMVLGLLLAIITIVAMLII